MDEASKPLRPHNPETIALGRQQIALIRARHQYTRPEPATQASPATPDDRLAGGPVEHVDAFGDRLAAEMAAGAERDLLVARITQLETEVSQLRAALAEILHTAAAVVSNPPTATANTAATEGADPPDPSTSP